MYSISRRDLPISQQSIQAGHSAIEYAFKYGRPPDHHPSYIHLTIKDKTELLSLMENLSQNGIHIAHFEEPYMDWGLTATSCLLDDSNRYLLSHLPLWRSK